MCSERACHGLCSFQDPFDQRSAWKASIQGSKAEGHFGWPEMHESSGGVLDDMVVWAPTTVTSSSPSRRNMLEYCQFQNMVLTFGFSFNISLSKKGVGTCEFPGWFATPKKGPHKSIPNSIVPIVFLHIWWVPWAFFGGAKPTGKLLGTPLLLKPSCKD